MTSSWFAESTDTVVLDEGDGYRIRALYHRLGSFEVIVVEWEHPNYGCFSDAMLWMRSLHCSDWKPFPVVAWSERYQDSESFLDGYPAFASLFERPGIGLMELVEDCESFQEE